MRAITQKLQSQVELGKFMKSKHFLIRIGFECVEFVKKSRPDKLWLSAHYDCRSLMSARTD
jgi:hypothetical protein